jgi:YesN/AraC family two-component response regulator
MSTIMIVEDEVSIGLELEELLESNGYEVISGATTGLEAISMARTQCPDLVLMDIKLPGEMDGIITARLVRQELGIPSVFLTGYGKSEFIERAKAADPLGYILKPLNESQILAAVEITIDKSDKEKSVREAREQDALAMTKSAEELDSAEKRFLEKSESLKKLTEAIRILTSL